MTPTPTTTTTGAPKAKKTRCSTSDARSAMIITRFHPEAPEAPEAPCTLQLRISTPKLTLVMNMLHNRCVAVICDPC